MTILVTGGAGFIGFNFVKSWLESSDEGVITLDLLTYAGHPRNVDELALFGHHYFVRGDIGDRVLVDSVLHQYKPRAIINFAAESHVDRSIDNPSSFLRTNVSGVFELLEAARTYWQQLDAIQRVAFRFLHISTDEVFGTLSATGAPFSELSQYAPNSPYAASKAASDHLVRAWHHTYGLPVLTTNCSNNYGQYQFPEKLIRLIILNALAGRDLPIYGDGRQVRDWLHVGDHCDAIRRILCDGVTGETYNIGGENERTNLEVVQSVCDLLDELSPRQDGFSYRLQIRFVRDRAGHDRRYAINASKLRDHIGWAPKHTFESGLRATVQWYLGNTDWARVITDGAYRNWTQIQYGSLDV